MAQRINSWARLGDGNKTYQIIKNLFNGGIYANLFDSADLSQYEDKCDLVVHAGTGKIDTNLKVVQGLGLLYPYMGTEPIYDEIQKIVSE